MSFGSILSNKNGQAGSFIGGNKPLGDIEKAAFKVKSTEVQDYHWGSPRRRVKSRKGTRGWTGMTKGGWVEMHGTRKRSTSKQTTSS